MNIMKAEDYKFPVLKESDAMFSADTAPEWADGDCCHRCRVQFGMVQRKVRLQLSTSLYKVFAAFKVIMVLLI